MTVTPKIDIAAEMLESSIELFLRGDSFHSSLHLASGAEALLNVCARNVALPGGALTPNFDQVKAMLVEVLGLEAEQDNVRAEKWTYDRLVGPRAL